ncbi:uncharacterized protein LOC108832266 [Raphanus sativus]|uniref:Uncharacterized protein LOC108832266 n=1 Tax=Raphanus sativus TaxID=3726 RepID=A0A9W3CQ97_RAPSA|nr:uncharacterized protein LOC108832266 [Raphanus sativus]
MPPTLCSLSFSDEPLRLLSCADNSISSSSVTVCRSYFHEIPPATVLMISFLPVLAFIESSLISRSSCVARQSQTSSQHEHQACVLLFDDLRFPRGALSSIFHSAPFLSLLQLHLKSYCS